MSSIVAICNLALSNIGKENINSLTDAEPGARACRQFYDHTRDTLLQAYPWRFAEKRVVLAEVPNDRGDWARAYQRPADCLKVRDVLTAEPVTLGGYAVSADRIYSNAASATLIYTARANDPSRYPPLFTDALCWHLAVRLAMPLTRDPKLRADAWQVAQQMTGAAQMADANETRAGYWTETDLVEGRG